MRSKTNSTYGKKQTSYQIMLSALAIHGESDECLIWEGCKTKAGYGITHIEGRQRYVHRLTYDMNNEAPAGLLEVCHKCDTPSCFNPRHLFSGTHLKNMQDAAEKDRWKRGEDHFAAVLTDDIVREIRRIHEEGKLKSIAERFGISITTVSEVLSSHCWSHVI